MHHSGGITRRSASTLLAALTGAVACPATAMAAGTSRGAARPEVVARQQLGPRTFDIMIDSPAVGREVPVRIILPAGYDSAPDRSWPVLYLLHGAGDDYTAWTLKTSIEEFTADKDVLTVMPDAGRTGIATRWWMRGRPGAPDYEAFQVDEVMGVLQQQFRATDVRVVAGISTGAYAAMAHAARRPGAFRAAAAYSGMLHTTLPGIPAFIHSIVAREGIDPLDLWGSPRAQADIWAAHNPRDQAAGLRGTQLYVSCGSGLPREDGDPWDAAVLEGIMWPSTLGFLSRLRSLEIPVTTHLYRGGTHSWPPWQREFLASWPLLARGLGLPEQQRVNP